MPASNAHSNYLATVARIVAGGSRLTRGFTSQLHKYRFEQQPSMRLPVDFSHQLYRFDEGAFGFSRITKVMSASRSVTRLVSAADLASSNERRQGSIADSGDLIKRAMLFWCPGS